MTEGVEEHILTELVGGVRKPERTWMGRIKIQNSLYRSEGHSKTDKMNFGRDLGRRNQHHPFKLRIPEPQMRQERLKTINKSHQGVPFSRDQSLFLVYLTNPDTMIRKIAMH